MLWDLELTRRAGAATLVAIAREGRLWRGFSRICPTWVDATALAILDAALNKHRTVSILYPAAAGDVSVLLAAQVLLHRFLRNSRSQSVGLVTAAPSDAVMWWRELAIVAPGNRASIADVFPPWRAEPDGSSPFGKARFRGLLVGKKCVDWRADLTIVDSLAGPVLAQIAGPSIYITADPLDRNLKAEAEKDGLIWGWSERILSLGNSLAVETCRGSAFSLSSERLRAITAANEKSVIICYHPKAEKAFSNLREDLSVLSRAAEATTSRHVRVGLRLAWSYTSALAALPCRPSEFDRFAGLPPAAARATSSFSDEITAWGNTLTGDIRDYALIVASDLSDLRAALEEDHPFHRALIDASRDPVRTLVVCRNRTSVRAFLTSVGQTSEANAFGSLTFLTYAHLHREGVWDRVLVVGPPPRAGWHRIDSGLSEDLRVLVIGDAEASRAEWAFRDLGAARSRWSSAKMRDHVWRQLVDNDPPPAPYPDIVETSLTTRLPGAEFVPEPDPYSPLGALLGDDRPLISESDNLDHVAVERPGAGWVAEVMAVEVATDRGTVLLERESRIDVIVGNRIKAVPPNELKGGDRILIGRREGRVGLMDALQDTFAKLRPDLAVAYILMKDYRKRLQRAFLATGMSAGTLYQRLVMLGCTKDEQTVRSWVEPYGPMAPRDFNDNKYLVMALGLDIGARELREIFSGVLRIRGFRISAGQALARAAVAAAASTNSADAARLEKEMGVSIADLKDAVIEANVIATRILDTPVPVTALGRLI
jgi:hypothetical protein